MPENGWTIEENGYREGKNKYYETLFSLGNGYLGVRGTLEEGGRGSYPGTYIAGVFDRITEDSIKKEKTPHWQPGGIPEIVNFPNWLGLKIRIDGELLKTNKRRVLSHRRTLDLKKGILHRETTFGDTQGRIIKLSTERIVSVVNLHLCLQKLVIKSVNYTGPLTVESIIDGNIDNHGVKHLKALESGVFDGNTAYLMMKTLESEISIIEVSRLRYSKGSGKIDESIECNSSTVVHRCELEIKKGKQFALEKYVCICTSEDKRKDLKKKARKLLESSAAKGYRCLRAQHQAEWLKRWKDCDVVIKGDDFAQLSTRFGIFHLLQSANEDDDKISIAAKGLTGEGYWGHIFWDTEIFLFPFFAYTQPRIARKLLSYRYGTLDGARKNARLAGYRGARYPLESALSGEEMCARWCPDTFTGKPFRFWAGENEIHVNASVPYAIWQYYNITGDKKFLYDKGAEIIIETARFWASRVKWNKIKERYEIRRVVGPDEYHQNVNNNAYTNVMAKWNIDRALEIIALSRKEKAAGWRKLRDRLGYNDEDISLMKDISDKMFIPYDEKISLFAQFDGFAKLKDLDLKQFKFVKTTAHAVIGLETLSKSQVIKQADVIMLLYLLRDRYNSVLKKANWDFYAPRTAHGSSLSPAVYSIVAAELGLHSTAYKFYKIAAAMDLNDVMGNTEIGIHTAALGGAWQVVINGFAGLQIKEGKLKILPRLPKKWESLKFAIKWRGIPLKISISREKIEIRKEGSKEIDLFLGDRLCTLKKVKNTYSL